MSDEPQINSTGKTTSVQFGSASAEESPQPSEAVKVNPETQRVTSGQSESLGIQSHNTADSFNPKDESKGVLATAQTSWGSRAQELNDKTLVTVDGFQTTLQAAHQMGYVGKDGNGAYFELPQNQPASNERQPQESSESGVVVSMGEEVESTIQGLNETLGSSAVLSAVAEYAAKGGLQLEDIGKYVDPSSGVSTEQVYEAASASIAAMESQVYDYLTEVGLTEEHHPGFAEFVNGQGKTQYQSTIMEYVTTRDLSVWHDILRNYADWNRRQLAKYRP
ncbi:hypothetical protein [uncultured Methylophaga sp.]|uniref:hypothetical protein n=1 Tax=uncultured Methylophaga sp. TaxID=285271 RepID=UPI00261AAD9E|nr:hypothetical protein [uncultured Methylophaga sp.]